MQPHNNDQCPAQSDPDGRRDDERCSIQTPTGLVLPQGFNPADGTLCLNVDLTGKGGAAA